jgi:hypothetical protein
MGVGGIVGFPVGAAVGIVVGVGIGIVVGVASGGGEPQPQINSALMMASNCFFKDIVPSLPPILPSWAAFVRLYRRVYTA